MSELPTDLNAQGYISRASSLMNAGQFLQAVELLKMGRVQHLKSIPIINKLAFCYIEQGHYKPAHDLLLEGVILDPNEKILRRQMGSVCMHLWKNEEAERHLKHALHLDVLDTRTYGILNDFYIGQARFDEATQLMRAAGKNGLDDQLIRRSAAKLLLHMGKYRASENMLERAVDVSRKDTRTLVALAVVRMFLRQWDRAAEALCQADQGHFLVARGRDALQRRNSEGTFDLLAKLDF